jgi:hypothetical protein
MPVRTFQLRRQYPIVSSISIEIDEEHYFTTCSFLELGASPWPIKFLHLAASQHAKRSRIETGATVSWCQPFERSDQQVLARSARYRRFCIIIKFSGLSVHGQSRGPSSIRRPSRPSAAFLQVHRPTPNRNSNVSITELKRARFGPPRAGEGTVPVPGRGGASSVETAKEPSHGQVEYSQRFWRPSRWFLSRWTSNTHRTDWPILALLTAGRPDFCERCSGAASPGGSGSAAIRASIRRPGRIRGDSRWFLASIFQDGLDQLGGA